MSFSLAPHPIGIKWWTNLWKENKSLSGAELHTKLSDYVYHKTHRSIGRFFFPHRAGPLGVKAPLVVLFLGLKLGAMAYGANRDRAAAVDVAAAYGMGGHMLDATPNKTELGELTEIARTSKSVVYRGQLGDQPIAVKEISTEKLKTQQCVQHVVNERQILQLLTEAEIAYACKLIGTLKTETEVYLVMEFVEGELLTDFLERTGFLKEDEIRSIFRQVVEMLADLHARGIVYRDLKLTNLIIKDGQLRLIDFGLSKLVGLGGRTKSICGTVHAMAPEIVNPPPEGFSFEVDCWALGILLYELFEFRAPFGYTRTEGDFLKSPESLVFSQTEDFDAQDLIKRLLTVDVHDRFGLADVRQHPWMTREAKEMPVDGVAAAVVGDTFWDNF